MGRALRQEIVSRLLLRDSHAAIPPLHHLFQPGPGRCGAELAERRAPAPI